jgi:hypothetical protein
MAKGRPIKLKERPGGSRNPGARFAAGIGVQRIQNRPQKKGQEDAEEHGIETS